MKSEITRDSIHGMHVALEPDETLVATLAPNLATFWRSNAILALAGGVVAGAALVYVGNPSPWVGPVAAVLSIGARAAYLRSEAMAEIWRLTNRRLLGPAGRIVPLSSLKLARPFFGAVQLVTQTGDKHLIKYQADVAETLARIDAARPGPP